MNITLDTTALDGILRDEDPGEKVLLNPTRGPIPTHGTGGFDYNWLVANSNVGVWFRANMTDKFTVAMDVVQLRGLAFTVVFQDEKPVTFHGMIGDYAGQKIENAAFEPETKDALVRLYSRVYGRTKSRRKETIAA